MTATINGKTYNTKRADYVGANNPTATTEAQLYRTKRGEFFLEMCVTFLDGKQLAPHDKTLWQLEQSLSEAERRKRLKHKASITPMTWREALVWSIKAQMPEEFCGYLLECLPDK